MNKTAQQQGFRISVVIPAYNLEDCIARTIQSVLDQTYPAAEIIVVDDGSTDKTAEAVQQFGDKVRYIYQENAGQSNARNTGIKHADFEWIAFLDGDDEWLSENLQRHTRLLIRHPELMWSTANYIRCLCNDNIKGPALPHDKAKALLDGKDYFDNYFYAYRHKASGNSNTFLIHKTVFDKVGVFDETMTFSEDPDMWWRIAYRYPAIGFLPEALSIYHLNRPNTVTARNRTKKFEVHCRLMTKHLQLAEEYGQLEQFRPLASYLVTSWIRAAFFANRPDEIRTLLKSFSSLLKPGFIRLTKLLIIWPAGTAFACHTISRIVRGLKLRKEVIRRPDSHT